MARYDLHLHSHCSDGTLAPAALMGRAHCAGVEVLALTDHDCTDGLAEAAGAASALGMRLVPGVEISTKWCELTVHVIGLGIRSEDESLRRGLARLVEERRTRAREIAHRLERRHIPDAYAGALRLAGGAILGRTHFARFLVQEGHVASMGQAFKQYLLRGGAAYVPGRWATLEEAVAWINGAGGQAVIAHPMRYPLSTGRLRKLLAQFKSCGGAGMEVVCGAQAPKMNARCAALAHEAALLASVGSDYHGPQTPWLEPGRLLPLPAGCVPVWRHWREETHVDIC